MYDKKRVLRKVDLAIFCYNVKYHNCYGNGIAITAEGNVLPCIMSRPLTLGNVKHQEIVSISHRLSLMLEETRGDLSPKRLI